MFVIKFTEGREIFITGFLFITFTHTRTHVRTHVHTQTIFFDLKSQCHLFPFIRYSVEKCQGHLFLFTRYSVTKCGTFTQNVLYMGRDISVSLYRRSLST